MKEEFVIAIRPDGRIVFIDDPGLGQLKKAGLARQRRASHITPINPALRVVFQALRIAFGETGRVAAWTRRWPCRWRADLRLSGGPISYGPNGDGFSKRQDAIDFEYDWIQENYLANAT